MTGGAGRRPIETLLVATHNAGKTREVREFLRGIVKTVLTQDEAAPGLPEAEETGETYAENALLKACPLFEATGLPTFGDDSGLEVDALGGLPGVHSKRFAPTNDDRIRKLLSALDARPAEPRTARFRCTIALLVPGSEPVLLEGVCEGEIIRTARGTGGFGYDPVFLPAGSSRTMAELTTAEKNRISHRARALEKLRDWLGETC